MNNIIISQSLTKALGFYVIEDQIWDVAICPRAVYEISIMNRYKKESIRMSYGDYLETGCIGSGHKGDKIIDLPRKKLTEKQKAENIVRESKGEPLIVGDKLIAQERLDRQIERFSLLCAQKQINVIPGLNTQIPLISHYKDNIYVSGVTDIFPTSIIIRDADGDDRLALAVIDLKGTADVNSEYFNKDEIVTSLSCWGKPEFLAKNQSLIYNYLVRHIDLNLIKEMIPDDYERINNVVTDRVLNIIKNHGIVFYFMALGYEKDITLTDPQFKFVQMQWNKEREEMFCNLIDKAVQAYMSYEIHGWKPCPSNKMCSKCPVLDCDKKSIDLTI